MEGGFIFGGGLTIHVSILVHINNVSLSLCLIFLLLQVVVHITDENDCTPEFIHSIYSRDNVPETTPTGTSLLQGECLFLDVSLFPSLLPSHFLSLCPCFSPGGPALEAGAVAVCSAGATVSSTQSCNYEIIHYGSTFWVVNGL